MGEGRGEGETRQSHHRVIPSKARNLGSRNRHAGLDPVSIEQCTTSSRHCGLDPQSRGAGCARQQQDKTTLTVILALRQYPQGGELAWMRHTRHCGLDPQSRGAACGAGQQQDKTTDPAVILALRQYPQGGETPIQHSAPSPASK